MDWLKNLKAGDKVIVTSRTINGMVKEIDEIRKNYILIDGDTYGRCTGWSLSNTSGEIHEATQDKIEEINRRDHRQNLINTIKDYDLLEAGVEVLEKIVKIIKEEQCEV